MHPASSASYPKRKLKNKFSFWYFCQCNINPFTDLQEEKIKTNQKKSNKNTHKTPNYYYYTTAKKFWLKLSLAA